MPLAHRPEIERLRAIAVLSVLIYHFFPNSLPGGFIGVDIFFVISGFLITRIIVSGLSAGTFNLLDFYRRRIRRIFPALILVLAFVLTTGWFLLFSTEYEAIGRHIIASGLFVQNFILYGESGYFDRSAEAKPLLHLWSLSVEEQFYLVWPLLLILWSRRRWKLHTLLIPLLCASLGMNLWIRHKNPAADFFWPMPRFWELLTGALLVLLPRPAPQDYSRFLWLMGGVLMGLGFFLINARMSFPGFWALLPTLGAALVIASGGQGPNQHSNVATRWIDYMGRISYPLYLWHWPLLSLGHIVSQGSMSLMMKLALISTTGVLAALTYHLFEKPLRKDQSWRSPRLLLTLMVTLMGVGGAILHYGGLPERAIEKHNPNRLEHPIPGFESLASDCSRWGASEPVLPHCKVFAPANANQTIVLWGDSSAIAWTPIFLDLAKARNTRLMVIGHTSCPPLLSARKTHFDLPESAHYCQDGHLQWEVLRFIENLRPNLIVFMGAFGGYRTDLGVAREDTEFVTDQEGEEANRLTNRRTLLRRMPETLNRLSEVAPVLMFRNWPLLPGSLPPPSHRSLQDLLNRGTEPRYYPRSYFDVQRQFVDEILFSETSQNIAFFDPATKVCDEVFCSNEVEGISAYSDRYHITPKAALTYYDSLNALIDRSLRP